MAEIPTQTSGGSLAGKWTGSFGGRVMDVNLSGSNSSLSGTITVTFGSNSARTPVRGRYDETSRTLLLTAYEDSEAIARYALALDDGGNRLRGSSTSLESGNKLSVSLKRK